MAVERWLRGTRVGALDLGADLFDAALDRRCPGCGGAVPRRREVCEACDAAVPRSGSALCLRCLRGDPPAGGARGRGCATHGPDRLLLAGPAFEAPLDRIVRAYKYDGVSKLAEWVASLVPEPPELRGPLGPTYALIPVPLHPARLAHRGFDQTSLLARALSRRWGVPVVSALRRVEDTSPQARLTGDARRRNLAGAFQLTEPAIIRDRAILLLDDVATTGSTLLAAADALQLASPSWILSLACTHGGDPDIPAPAATSPRPG